MVEAESTLLREAARLAEATEKAHEQAKAANLNAELVQATFEARLQAKWLMQAVVQRAIKQSGA